MRGGIASIMFQLPLAKHNYAWAGCMPAGAPALQEPHHMQQFSAVDAGTRLLIPSCWHHHSSKIVRMV
jgi:hypothetical protein